MVGEGVVLVDFTFQRAVLLVHEDLDTDVVALLDLIIILFRNMIKGKKGD